MLSLCFFNLYAEYTMRNDGLGEAQAGIKIARSIDNLGQKRRQTEEPLNEGERVKKLV